MFVERDPATPNYIRPAELGQSESTVFNVLSVIPPPQIQRDHVGLVAEHRMLEPPRRAVAIERKRNRRPRADALVPFMEVDRDGIRNGTVRAEALARILMTARHVVPGRHKGAMGFTVVCDEKARSGRQDHVSTPHLDEERFHRRDFDGVARCERLGWRKRSHRTS